MLYNFKNNLVPASPIPSFINPRLIDREVNISERITRKQISKSNSMIKGNLDIFKLRFREKFLWPKKDFSVHGGQYFISLKNIWP